MKSHPIVVLCLAMSLSFSLLEAQTPRDFFTDDDFERIEKIDSHVHINTWNTSFLDEAKEINFRFLNIAVNSADPATVHLRHETGYHLHTQRPEQLEVIASFPLEGWNSPDWTEKTIRYIDEARGRGARGIKIWKNIGMEFRDDSGQLVMVDAPQLRPVIDHIENRGLLLIGHLGEPKNCWLPLEQMTVNNDRSYFERHPEYHMFLHPEMPSYEDQITARDRMLAQHPKLKFIGAHFGSLEWSVNALRAFLDRFPLAWVDTAARMGQLQYQSNENREQVRSFMIKYQDRIVYGTDLGLATPTSPQGRFRAAVSRWKRDWSYLCTEKTIKVPELDSPVKGLNLPAEVVQKIYSRNIKRLLPDAWSSTE